jgi:C1A family cysteine protease
MKTFAFLALATIVAGQDDLKHRQAFKAWMTQHKPEGYPMAGAEEHAFANFKQSVQTIEVQNARAKELGSSARYALNHLADLSPEEFRAKYLMAPRSEPADAKSPAPEKLLTPKPEVLAAGAPNAVDWVAKGAVTPVKNQEQCGSCWAFSATEEIESMWILAGKATNTTVDLAPQQIVDCDDSDNGCGGGHTETAYDYVKQAGGIEPEKDYPYTASDGNCKANKSEFAANITGWKRATTDYDEQTMQANMVSWGPLSVCLDASHWQHYSSGIMTAWECAWINLLDHCVQAVGYDLNNGNPYWNVRNSWGTQWGINGFIQLQMFKDTCGIAHDVTSVTI